MYNSVHETDSSTHHLCLMWQTMQSWAAEVKWHCYVHKQRSYYSKNVYPLYVCLLLFFLPKTVHDNNLTANQSLDIFKERNRQFIEFKY